MNRLPDSLIPDNEPSRLRTLHQYQVLNTTPERIFDEYAALAAELFNLPISLVSLVAEEEVVFKANEGLPGLERVARPDSLCSAAVLQNQVLTYSDLATEGCSLVNPFVARSAGLRFYAGAALRMPDGSAIGSLCVMGREPRPIEPAEEKLLMALAELVTLTIELRHTYVSRQELAEWEVVQQELEATLHEHAALARYLISRQGSAPVHDPVSLTTVMRRLGAVRDELAQRLAARASQPLSA